MASFKKVSGGHKAQIAIKGRRRAKAFSTKAEAKEWAKQRETEIRRQVASWVDAGKTCSDAFDKYYKTVSIHKKGPEWEKRRMCGKFDANMRWVRA